MPVVPIEENKIGIAGLTDAKLRPADLAGSGLDAIGGGLRAVGKAGFDLGKAVGAKPPPSPKSTDAAASTAPQAEPKPIGQVAAPEKATPPITLTPTQAADDAAVKGRYCDYVAATRQLLNPNSGEASDRQGIDPATAARERSDQLVQAYKGVAADLSPEQHEALHGVMTQRLAQDQNLIRNQEAAAALDAQRQQSQRVVDTCADDAVLHFGTPVFGHSMATGLNVIAEQATLGGWPPEARQAAEKSFISGVHRRISESYAAGDAILGAAHLRLFRAHMTPEDFAASWQALRGPLVQTQAVADADTLWIGKAATAPLTPRGDPALLVQRMLAITPATPAGNEAGRAGTSDTTDLPALVERYGGDAAKAWAAATIGTDALDALLAKHGATWFGALPEEAHKQVAADMAMLGAATSPRQAPTPEEQARLVADIEGEPWSDERKQNVHAELNTRIGLEARRVKKAQDDAWEKGLGVADQLGEQFISINQLPPAIRTGLAPEALAALTLRADRNVHPVRVTAHADVAMGLNRMAATDPEGFAKEDLRLHRDEMTPAEYDALDRVQKAWSGYPPGAAAVTQQRSIEKAHRSGLDIFSEQRGDGIARPVSLLGSDTLNATRDGMGSIQARVLPAALVQDGGAFAMDRADALAEAKAHGGDPVQLLRQLRGQPPLPQGKTPPPPRVPVAPVDANRYSPENLELGPNAKYADLINAAARQYHLPPQTIAALIGAEAAVGVKGWDPMSYNSQTGASGLAQFKSDTWQGEAERTGSYLNGRARSLGFLDKRGKVMPAHKQELLKLRFNPSDAIFTAADYAQYNIQNLTENNLLVDNTPTALAKYAYIMHHDGRKGGKLFLRGRNNSATAFRQGLAPAQREKYLRENNNNIDQAYRAFFNDFIDSKIDISKYMRDSRGVSVPSTMSLYTLSQPKGP